MAKANRYAFVAAACCVLIVLFIFNPTEHVWIPKCPVKLLFGVDCPGCGVQRALHALLHGHHHHRILRLSFANIRIFQDLQQSHDRSHNRRQGNSWPHLKAFWLLKPVSNSEMPSNNPALHHNKRCLMTIVSQCHFVFQLFQAKNPPS